jgi:hypothetical protein
MKHCVCPYIESLKSTRFTDYIVIKLCKSGNTRVLPKL